MNDALTQVIVWLNGLANAVGRVLLAPIAWLPGWLSATLVAVVTGMLLLVLFKYTSNQRAIKRVRDQIKAHLLSLKLFKESNRVIFKAQGGILSGAAKLFVLAIVPMLVMIVPVCLVVAQLSLWYQTRPLHVGEEALLVATMNGAVGSDQPDVQLEPSEAVEVTLGPAWVPEQRALHWNIVARQPGQHRLVFRTDDQQAEKELAIGDGFLRTSPLRPSWNWFDALLYPAEEPFPPDAVFQSIEINDPPGRDSWTSGSYWWIYYWFAASMVAAFCFRPFLNVNI